MMEEGMTYNGQAVENENDYYRQGVEVGREYEKRLISEFLTRRKRANALYINIDELLHWLETDEEDGDFVSEKRKVNNEP